MYAMTDTLTMGLYLGATIFSVLALYWSFPWIERVYDRWRYRRMAKVVARTQKNRWN
jgi:antibiotic biosynthesis monooxygenase (ABM) superfamily enzyme